MNRKIIVQKYGGSSVASAEKVKAVAKFIKEYVKKDLRLCVVVSAMGKTTNDLLDLADQVCEKKNQRELDMLISCGERSSMALLSMALNDLDVKSVSLTGSQSGIITCSNHGGASIEEIKPHRVLSALEENQVVIIAGFQGVSRDCEITTLKRGGSDTTAVAMTAALNAESCEIYSDVEGVLDADPRIVKDASIISQINFDEATKLTLYGARVLAFEACVLAKQFGIKTSIQSTHSPHKKTQISGEPLILGSNKKALRAITHLRAVLKINLGKNSQINCGQYFLCGHKQGEDFVAYVSNDLSQELRKNSSLSPENSLALITLHIFDQASVFNIFDQARTLLEQKEIALKDCMVSHGQIFLVINDCQLNAAINILHENPLTVEA